MTKKKKQNNKKRVTRIAYGALFGAGIFGIAYAGTFLKDTTEYTQGISVVAPHIDTTEENKEITPKEVAAHVSLPDAVKAIYMSSCVAGTPSFRKDLVEIAETTEINTIIIDIKDYTGKISFYPEYNKDLDPYVSDRCRAPDMKEFIEELHEKGIFVAGRVTVFQDPFFVSRYPDEAVKRESDGGIWSDHKGINFIDVSSKKAWDHVIAIAKESYAIGFDEINFDYIRFPSDGNMKDISFPISGDKDKSEALEEFFAYLHDNLKDTGMVTSADLFGMVTTNTDDLNIGQVLEKALPYFDYIMPMVYPSHFPATFNGWGDPNKVPYEIIKYTMDAAVERTVATTTPIQTIGSSRIGTSTPAVYTKASYDKNKIRPWLQDFDYGGNYDIAEVRAQIQATYDAGLNSWMLWAPSNRYTIGALEKDSTQE